VRVGLIGVGAIGRTVADALASGSIPGMELAAIAGRPGSSRRLAELARGWHCRWTADPLELPSFGSPLVVEAAGVHAARAYAVALVRAGSDVVLMSAGALAEPGFAAELVETAGADGARVYVPAGAIGGLDSLMAAAQGGVDRVTLTTRKPPAALHGAPHLERHAIDLHRLDQPKVVFEGSAVEAIQGFPANANVAVTVGLAVGDIHLVKVRIIADPDSSSTVHRLEAHGDFGRLAVEVANRPSPDNPRTSRLAALSAVHILRRIAVPLRVG
jgi:aspartate dehydrogenase